MSAKPKNTPKNVTVTTKISISGKPLELKMQVPTGRTRPARMLPLFRSLTETFVNSAVESVRAEGFEISCAKGCCACCRHMIPVSEFEARQLRDLVNKLPEPRKSIIIKRFEEAQRRMSEAGLLEKLIAPEQITKEEYRSFGLKYFQQGVPCPFLEENTCSIYSERPLVCREYLVVSPAERCERLTDEPIQVLNSRVEMSKAVRCFNSDQNSKMETWIPLILALDWADSHEDESAERSGTELLLELFKTLTGRDVPDGKS